MEQISPGEKEAQEKYRDYVEGSLDQTPENPLEKATASILLGSDTFVEWVKKNFIGKATSHRDVPALAKLSLWPSLSTIQGEVEKKFEKGSSIARKVAIFLAHRYSGLPLEEIGRHFGGIGPSAVTQNTKRLEPKMKGESSLREKIETIKQRIRQ